MRSTGRWKTDGSRRLGTGTREAAAEGRLRDTGKRWPFGHLREAAARGRLRERGKNASALIFFSARNLPMDANTTMQEMKRDAGVLEHFLPASRRRPLAAASRRRPLAAASRSWPNGHRFPVSRHHHRIQDLLHTLAREETPFNHDVEHAPSAVQRGLRD